MELKAKEITVFGAADPATYPLQKKGHTMEFLRDIAHLRTRSNTFGAVFRVRNALARAIHSFFQERGFLYVQTPIITASDAEGAGAMFGVTTLDLMNLPRSQRRRAQAAVSIDYAQDFFGKPAFLTVSGQLEAEIFALVLLQRLHLRPDLPGRKLQHAAPPRRVLDDRAGDGVLRSCRATCSWPKSSSSASSRKVMDTCLPDLEFFNKRIDNTVLETLEHVVNSDFEHVTYTEAIAHSGARAGRTWEFPVHWGADLQSEHERYLTEQTFKKPVIVTDYPKEIKAFYMRANDDGKTVRAMDVLAPRIGEIIGGSQREERYDVLLDKIRAQGLNEAAYWWYLELRKYGTRPARRVRPGLRAPDALPHRHEEHPRRDPLSAHARQRGVLT